MNANSSVAQNPTSGEYIPPQWSGDATLRDINFVDANTGIAVGDQGTVLRTNDGGRSWQLVFISNDCSLQSVCFSDKDHGWIAGGYSLPLVNRSRGVILQTSNGGQTWSELPSMFLPALRQIEFVSTQLGMVRCYPSPFQISGLATSNDSGQSWSDMAYQTAMSPSAVVRGGGGLLVANGGQMGIVRQDEFHPSRQTSEQRPAVHAIAMFDPNDGVALSDQSLQFTADGGQSWNMVELPDGICADCMQWTTVAARDGVVWLAGNPGSYIVRWDLATNAILKAATPIPTSICKLFFADDQRGWAVGDLGVILATVDGGKTWQRQRSASNRVGMLVVARTAAEIPFELLARYCGDQGYLGAVLLFDADQSLKYPDQQLRTQQAVGRVGGSIVQHSSATNQAAAVSELVRTIRQWQPSTILIGQSPDLRTPGGIDVGSATSSAATLAANANEYREMIDDASLQPWQTPKVLLAVAQSDPESRWGSAELLPKLGRNVSDFVLTSRALTSCEFPAGVRYNISYLSGMNLTRNSEVFDASQVGGLAPPRRRELKPQGYLGQIKTIGQKALSLQSLLDSFDGDAASFEVWSAKTNALVSELPLDVAGVWLWQLSNAYWRVNKTELAARARAKLIAVCPDHALALAARTWLIDYYASEEFAHLDFVRQQKPTSESKQPNHPVAQVGVHAIPTEVDFGGVKQLVWTPETPDKKGESADPRTKRSSAELGTEEPSFAQFYSKRLKLAKQLVDELTRIDPEYGDDPAMNLTQISLLRRLEGPSSAQAKIQRMSLDLLDAQQKAFVARENDIMSTTSPPPSIGLAHCPQIEQRPYLDGVLDDEAWRSLAQQDMIVRLQPYQTAVSQNDGSMPTRPTDDSALGNTQVLLAQDADFLYIAIQCRDAALATPSDTPTRTRDGNLSPSDYVEIHLDCDRDGGSKFVFGFDNQGNFVDRINDDLNWNPDWYFANSRSLNTWTIEAAIPWSELRSSSEPNVNDGLWGMSIERGLPGGKRECWQPAQSKNEPGVAGISSFAFELPGGLLDLR